MRLPVTVHVGLIALRFLPPVRRRSKRRTATGSLGSRAWSFYACMGSPTPQGCDALALTHAALLPSDYVTPWAYPLVDLQFRSSIPSLHIPLSNASSAVSRPPPHDSRPGWFATPFLYDSFIHDSTPVYPDAPRYVAGYTRRSGRPGLDN